MNKIAVIDIGSNSVRLMMMADGNVLYKTLATTRLGEGIAFSRKLSKVAISRTSKAVGEFFFRAKKEGAEEIYAFATAAVRSAENGKDFLIAVESECGLRVEVLSGETEAEVALLGALGASDGGVVDLGGASTELIFKRSGKIVYEKSINIGAVRLKDLCGRDYEALKARSELAVKEYGAVSFDLPVFAVGGTATTLAAIFLELKEYDSARVTGTKLSKEALQDLAKKLSGMTVEEIASLPCVEAKRAEILGGGAVLLATIAKELNFPKLIISDSDNLEGYARLRTGWKQ